MKNRLAQLAKGSVGFRKPDVSFSSDKLEGNILPERVSSAGIDIFSKNRVPMQLFFYSTNPRVKVSKSAIVTNAGKLILEIDAKGLMIADEIKGSVDIVYNGGEASIPYRFTVGVMASGTDPVRFATLEEFAEFAANRPDAALNLFSWKEFLMMPFMQDTHLTGLYKAIEPSMHASVFLREFLKASGVTKEAAKPAEEETTAEKKPFTPSPEKRKLEVRFKAIRAFAEIVRRDFLQLPLRPVLDELYPLYITMPDHPELRLAYAYGLYLDHETDEAKEALMTVQDIVYRNRNIEPGLYCAFLYLAGLILDDDKQLKAAAKQTHKYWQEGMVTHLLSLLEFKLNPDFEEDPEKAKEYLWQCDTRGLRSSLLLEFYAILLEEKDLINDRLGEFELKVILYAIRKDLISERKLFQAFSVPLTDPKLLNLYVQALKAGYMKFGNIEFLHALMNVFLQKKCIGPRYYRWYRYAIDESMTLRGLNEYYLASLPKEFNEKLPERLVQYFGYQRETSSANEARLYANVLQFYKDNETFMNLYRAKIDQFALKAAKEERYSLDMRPLFERILQKQYINEQTASSLLQLFYLEEVTTSLPKIRRVVLYYPELDKEDSYPAEDGGRKALVPVFSDEAVVVLETDKGDRLYDPDLKREKVFSDETLRKQCMLYAGESLLFKLKDADEVVRKGIADENTLFLVIELIKDQRIAPSFRTRLYETIINLQADPSKRHVDCTDFLSDADFTVFTQEYRAKMLSSFIDWGHEELAMERVLLYGADGVSDDHLLKLMENAVGHEVVKDADKVNAFCFRLFTHDAASGVILEYLADHFSGSTADMLSLLKAIRKKKLPLHSLTERTMTACIFSGNTRDLDALFAWYVTDKNRNETLVRAYLVLRSHEYYTEKRRISEETVRELEKQVKSLPRIGYLALMQYYALHPETVRGERKALAAELVKLGIDENVVPSSLAGLRDVIDLPFELENREFVTAYAPEALEVSVTGQVFPGNRIFHRKMQSLYPGVFEQSFILFEGEWIQYEILITASDGKITEGGGGVILHKGAQQRKAGRYQDLVGLEKKAKEMDVKEAAEGLKAMLVKETLISNIFEEGNGEAPWNRD